MWLAQSPPRHDHSWRGQVDSDAGTHHDHAHEASRKDRNLLRAADFPGSAQVTEIAPAQFFTYHSITPRGSAVRIRSHPLEHDPEKWKPVFRKDHAQTKG
jgi:hypothetical protein